MASELFTFLLLNALGWHSTSLSCNDTRGMIIDCLLSLSTWLRSVKLQTHLRIVLAWSIRAHEMPYQSFLHRVR
jgi:hypothetical protein